MYAHGMSTDRAKEIYFSLPLDKKNEEEKKTEGK
jgi:hypothetical protein